MSSVSPQFEVDFSVLSTLDCLFKVRVHIGPVHYTASYGFYSVDTWISRVWLFKNSFPEFCGNHNTIYKHQTLIDDRQRMTALLKLLRSPVRLGGHEYLRNLRTFCIVIYWPSTEPSIKRCTCVNKRKNSGSRWTLENNI